jgi:diguanylate cyclase (GGDEF)-like protein
MKKKKHKKIYKEFNLPRFFNLFSLLVIVIFSILLSFIFTYRQKNIIVDHSIEMAKSYAHHLNHEITENYNFDLVKYGSFKSIDKDRIRFNELDNIVRRFIKNYESIFKIKIYNREGLVIYSTDPDNIGGVTDSKNFRRALSNSIASELTKKENPLADKTEKGKAYELDILEVYVPTMSEPEHDYGHDHLHESVIITGVFEIYQDVTHMFKMVEEESKRISLYVFLAMTVLFFLLYAIVRKADGIISKKNEVINKHNNILEEAHARIRDSISEVIEHGSFHVRFQDSNLMKCWEVKNCKSTECPSYKSENLRCWQVAGTFCGGKVQGVFAQKYGDCRTCSVYQHAFSDKINMIGENFNNMMMLLESKHQELQNVNDRLNKLIDIDPLTQLGNRRSFQKRVEYVHQMSLRYRRPYSLIICDVDGFKIYNDTYGHQKGDNVLILISHAFRESIRKTDEIFRWGGEEFVIILPEQDLSSALNAAEHIRVTVESIGIEHTGVESGVVTVSIGVACNTFENVKSISWEKVLKQADDEMYRAKSCGKNCVFPPLKADKESNAGI